MSREAGTVTVTYSGAKLQLAPISVKVAHLREFFGSYARVAEFLSVARTQPGRWVTGEDYPNPDAARRIKDFEYLWDRATDEMHREDARIWLESANPLLSGATPLTVLRTRGPAEVIAALDAEAADSYA